MYIYILGALAATNLTGCSELSENWYKDSSGHWKEYTNSDEQFLFDNHHYGEEIIVSQPTCTNEGSKILVCNECNYIKVESIPASGHDKTSVWSKNELGHWHECKRKGCEEHLDFDVHHYDSSEKVGNKYIFKCTECNFQKEEAIVENNDTNEWIGKKWYALGTSLTRHTNNPGVPRDPVGTYAPYLKEMLQVDEVIDKGVDGGCFAGHLCFYAGWYGEDGRGEYNDFDLITIEGGVNDFMNSIPLGKVGDTIPYVAVGDDSTPAIYLKDKLGGNETGSFAGAVFQTLRLMQINAPEAKLVVITDPTGRYDPSKGGDCSRGRKNELGLLQYDYTETLIKVANYIGIQVIDAGRKCQVNEEHPQYYKDHIHHNEIGGYEYAKTIFSELRLIKPMNKTEE